MKNNKRTTIALFLALLFVVSTVFSYPVNAAVQEDLDLTGTWTWTYYNYGTSPYEHKMLITAFNPDTGFFSGTGYYTGSSITWTVTGNVDGSNVDFHILYIGSDPEYTVDAVGTIDSNGIYMDGDAKTSANQWGTWISEKDETESIISIQFPAGSTAVATVEIIKEGDLLPCILPLPDGLTDYIDVKIIQGTVAEGTIKICVQYDQGELTIKQEKKLRLYMSGHCVDFNDDKTINGQDLSIIKKGIKNGDFESVYGVAFDVNNDGLRDDADIAIVKEYMTKGLIVNKGKNNLPQARLPWIDITVDVDTDLDIICGETDHFSIFRGR